MNPSYSPPMMKHATPAGVLSALLICLSASLMSSPVQAQSGDVVGNVDAGRKKVSMCVGCHQIPGYKASFPSVYPVPMIVGQSAKYIESSLVAYKKGDRSHPTMRSIAGSMSAQDMADLAALYGSK
jgi:cytochrome c553